nr:alpha/beta hydrolase [uncultured Actinoplanes sp.]
MNENPEPDTPGERRGLSRRAFTGGAAAVAGASLIGGLPSAAAASAAGAPPPGIGSVTTSPNLPAGFTKTFQSRFVRANGIRQHVVVGGDGPPLLLVHGWPENWYAWRFLMPELARHHTVVAVDQRGLGLTDKPRSGYDSTTLANDMAALMSALGHKRYAVVGHDTGYVISYALAADHRANVARLVLAEIPGAFGATASPPLFLPDNVNDRVWHLPFNRVDDELIVDMIRGNEDGYFNYEFRIQSGGIPLPAYARRYYIDLYSRSRDVLRASLGFYRAIGTTLVQDQARAKRPITIPVLGVGGRNSYAEAAATSMKAAIPGIRSAVIPGAGHWVAEQAPQALLSALTSFLAPYRNA